jgi:hypothetical protein
MMQRQIEKRIEAGKADSAKGKKQRPGPGMTDLSCNSERVAKGMITIRASAQRRQVKAMGEIWPTASLPATALPPQASDAPTR